MVVSDWTTTVFHRCLIDKNAKKRPKICNSNFFIVYNPQLLVATPLETEQGHLRTLFVYFGGILFGALGSALLDPAQAMIGASAGVYSLLISHISHCVLVSNEYRIKWHGFVSESTSR